mmetsp:Transcript_53334/g.114604  ORF Transcript_53334/g.114604 Transcript_53334/m.114604 type:complete len:259 (-) Transcript_53334:349-1125(-)
MCCRREFSPYAMLELMHPTEKSHKLGEWSAIGEDVPEKKPMRWTASEAEESNRSLHIGGEQPGMCSRLKCCCGVLLTLAFGLLAGSFLVPREPSWKLDELQLVDLHFPKVGESADSIELHFEAKATIGNPNYVGMTTEPGELNIFYQGELIGSDTFHAHDIGRQSSVTVPLSVTVDHMPEALGVTMMKDLADNKGFLEVEARGSMMTTFFKALDVECTATCELTADVKNPPEFRARRCNNDCSLWNSMVLPALDSLGF